MNIRKLASGNYQIRETRNGKQYSVTIDHKPKKYEAAQLIEDEVDRKNRPEMITVGDAMQRYIDIKENVIAPSTIRGYTHYIQRYPDKFKDKDLYALSLEDIQALVNHFAYMYSGKYVHNLYGLLSASLRLFRPELNIDSITLPKIVRKPAYVPIDDDVKKLLAIIDGTEYEIPIALAAFGMRRSEICALTIEDLHDGYIVVNKTLVENKEGKWILNRTNNKSEERKVYIPKSLENKIREKGYIFEYTPSSFTRGMRKLLKEAGMPHFTPHKLRHYYASISHALGVPDVYIMQAGGWKTDHVMKSVYRHALSDKIEEMDAPILNHFESLTK